MEYINISKAKRDTGITYLGSVNLSAKHFKAYSYNEMTYGLYLAPAKLSGYEVCPMRTKECTKLCLNESGLNSMGNDHINNSRIKKTKLFFEHREFFMKWLIHEIRTAKSKAEKNNYRFSVRLNNTSDISPESFYCTIDGVKKNILEIFPDVMFYDYTKVVKRYELTKKYKNYDLTFSYSGENESECLTMLTNKIKVAVVFKNVLPDKYFGKKVINGDEYDMRYKDKGGVVVGLKYKLTRVRPNKNSKFIVSI